jgi:hypothetical protein
MNEQALVSVLNQYVIENANLKIQIEQLKQELEKAKEEQKEGE